VTRVSGSISAASNPVGVGEAGFRLMEESFARAMAANPDSLMQSSYRFGDRLAIACVVGSMLGRHFRRPFDHLQVEGGIESAELSIDLWDEAESGVPCPVDLGDDSDARLWTNVDDGVMRSSPDGRFVEFCRSGSVTWIDRGLQRMVGWRADGGRLLVGERAKPMTMPLFLWLCDHGVQVIHAGVVSVGGRGVLIGGPGGVGKSTTALSCLSAGFGYLGDDQIGLQESPGGSFVAHSLYNTARLEPGHFRRFPSLDRAAVRPEDCDDKCLVFLSDLFPDRLQRSVPISAVALPRVTEGSHSRISPARKAEALLRLSLSSLFMPLSPGARGLSRLARLVELLPCYWIDLGRELAEIPSCVEELLWRSTHHDATAH
jgi:hypothetical protein